MALNIQRRKQRVIENVEGEDQLISSTLPNELVYIQNCRQCSITIESAFMAKLILQSCKDVNVRVNSAIITSTCEVVNCENITLVLARGGQQVATVTLDNVNGCHLTLFKTDDTEGLPKPRIITSKTSSNISVSVLPLNAQPDADTSKLPVIHPATEKVDQSDYIVATIYCNEQAPAVVMSSKPTTAAELDSITHFITELGYAQTGSEVSCSLVTERLVREGAGYATTESRKLEAERRQQLIDEKMETFVKSMIADGSAKSTKKVASGSAPPPPPPTLAESSTSNSASQTVETPKPSGSLLGAIRNFSKEGLNRVETVETTLIQVQGKPIDNNIGFGHTSEGDMKEYCDSPAKLERSVKQVADYIRAAKHIVVYTGAGISTSAQLPDYRGPEGIWTMMNKGMAAKGVDLEQALPTYAHYALRELVDRGFVKYIVSTNVDGLHRRSGVPEDKISELHGNCYKEVCAVCGKEYLHAFDVTKSVARPSTHITGRKCSCGGDLKDTIVHFGENLPDKELENATTHANQSDLSLVIGTSLRVQPACLLPKHALKNRGKMVIVNLQKTPLDFLATKIHVRSDEFMERLMQELGIPVTITTPVY